MSSCFSSNVFFVISPYCRTRFLLVYHQLKQYNLLQLKPNWMQFLETNELIHYLLIADLSVTSVDVSCCFLYLNNYQKKLLDVFPYIVVHYQMEYRALFKYRGLVLHYEYHNVFPLFPIIISYVKEFVLLFYHDFTVDAGYNL